MRETLDRFQGGLQIGQWIVTNLCYADDIVMLATLEVELQELVDRLDRVNQPTHQRRRDQGNGERPHNMPHTHSEWATEAGGYVPIPWVPDYRRWAYDGIPYQVN